MNVLEYSVNVYVTTSHYQNSLAYDLRDGCFPSLLSVKSFLLAGRFVCSMLSVKLLLFIRYKDLGKRDEVCCEMPRKLLPVKPGLQFW